MDSDQFVEAVPPRKKNRLLNLIGALATATVMGLIVRDVTEPAAQPLWHTVKVMAMEKMGMAKPHDAPTAFVQHYSAKDREGLKGLFREASQ